ncbi:MAG TPA: M20 family metallopeptidase [Deinococcales bacterium]|nr:M20 family metallopeptidase [Deinococcales bacterium]
MERVRAYLQERQAEILRDIEALVRTESPSGDREGIGRVLDQVQAFLTPLASVERHDTPAGGLLHARVPAESSERVVLLAHADTVYPRGAWSELWRVHDGRAYGPGAYDMKGGTVQSLWALRALHDLALRPRCTVEFLLTPDEEAESRDSRATIERLAAGARAVLVLEPPAGNGDLKVARKGVGTYRLTVRGKAAHQGTEPEKGVNAVVAAAELIGKIVALQDLEAGTTLGPNVIHGGTVSNVVADLVELKVDVRVWTQAEATRVDAAMQALRPSLEGASVEVRDGLNRPPMEPGEGAWGVFEKARAIAASLGLPTGAARVGGGSDGNFTASLAPTLDGFGAMGAAAHQRDLEYIEIDQLVPRATLLAQLLLDL